METRRLSACNGSSGDIGEWGNNRSALAAAWEDEGPKDPWFPSRAHSTFTGVKGLARDFPINLYDWLPQILPRMQQGRKAEAGGLL